MVHSFKRAGLCLALDVGSGAVHVLDLPAYEMLAKLEPRTFLQDKLPKEFAQKNAQQEETQLTETFEELKELVDKGFLFSDDDYSDFSSSLGVAPVKAMCLHMAHDCNLRCKYCFASTGGFGGTRKLMPFDIAKKAIDLLVKLSCSRHNLEVDFFGGEPLMNFGVVKETLSYARQIEKQAGKNFRFTITTNGLSLNNEISDYINREMTNVVLSLDGRKSINDAMRPMISGKGSYSTIVPKFQQLVNSRKDKEYYVRGTYTRHNLDFDKDVLELFNLGFRQISVEPVVGPESDNYSIREKDIPQLENSYIRLMESMIENIKAEKKSFNFFHFMLDLSAGPCAIKRLKGCGCGNEYLAVTPDGELYPCHQFVGKDEFLMGNVNEGITKSELKNTFANTNLLNKPKCQNCWAKYYCSGGCSANNIAFTGSLQEPHQISCQLEKIRLECAIAVQAARAIAGK